MLASQPRLAGSELVFQGYDGAPITGWSKPMRPGQVASRKLAQDPGCRTIGPGKSVRTAMLSVRNERVERIAAFVTCRPSPAIGATISQRCVMRCHSEAAWTIARRDGRTRRVQ